MYFNDQSFYKENLSKKNDYFIFIPERLHIVNDYIDKLNEYRTERKSHRFNNIFRSSEFSKDYSKDFNLSQVYKSQLSSVNNSNTSIVQIPSSNIEISNKIDSQKEVTEENSVFAFKKVLEKRVSFQSEVFKKKGTIVNNKENNGFSSESQNISVSYEISRDLNRSFTSKVSSYISIKNYNIYYKKYLFIRDDNKSNNIYSIQDNSNSQLYKEVIFEFTGIILGGSSSYKVLLYKSRLNSDLFVFKIFKKSKLKEIRHFHSILSEAKIQKNLFFPFLLSLFDFFQDDYHIYFITEYIVGGDLKTFLIYNKILSEKTIQFIIAQIVLAIEYLHSRKIIFRDLKPENILISYNGYLKLTDFSLARQISEYNSEKKTISFCGTPEFIAPEMIRAEECDNKIDIWAMGILIFELFYGKTPFSDRTISNLYKKIVFNEIDYSISKQMRCKPSKEALDLLKKMLVKDKSKRINIEEIIQHDYFKDFSFNEILKMNIISPLKTYSEKNKFRMEKRIEEMEIEKEQKEERTIETDEIIKFDIGHSPINQNIPFKEIDNLIDYYDNM